MKDKERLRTKNWHRGGDTITRATWDARWILKQKKGINGKTGDVQIGLKDFFFFFSRFYLII